MYCPTCDCEYNGWNYRCPVCKSTLQEHQSELPLPSAAEVHYDEFVKRVRQAGGRLSFEVNTTQVRKKRDIRFPFRGYGFAWADKLSGEQDGLQVEMFTTRVEEDRSESFPYFGYGFAWEQEMEGQVGGHPLALQARAVQRKRGQAFPYLGRGYAWTEQLTGSCGPSLEATLETTQVRRSRGFRFPYFSFGYAWVASGILNLTLIEAADS